MFNWRYQSSKQKRM